MKILKVMQAITTHFRQIAEIVAGGEDLYWVKDLSGRYAAAFALVQLGEQAKRLGDEFTRRHTEPQYSEMAQQRDFLVHQLHKVSWRMLWNTLTESVPRSAVAHIALQLKLESRMHISDSNSQ